MAKANRMKLALVLEATAKMEGIKKANKDLKDLQAQVRKLQPLLNMTKKALISLGGMGYAFYRLVDGAHKLGDEVTKLASATGASTTDLQVLGRVAAQNGAKLEDMSKGLLTLTKSTQAAANGNKGLADRFARLGIELTKFKTLSPERQMERLGLAVNAASDKQAALAEIMALVGTDAAPKLIQSLQALGEKGYDQLKEKAIKAGEVMSEEAIESLSRIDQTLSDIGHRFKAFAAEWSEGAMLIYDAWIKTDKAADAAAKALDLRARFGGVNNPRVAKAAIEAARAGLEAGNTAAARFWLKDSQKWMDNAKALLEKNPKLPVAKLVSEYEALQKRLGEINERAAARNAKLEAVAAETRRVQQEAQIKAKEDAVLAELALIEAEQQKVADITLGIHRAHAKQRAEAEKQAQEELKRSVADTLATLAQFEFDSLAPSEQLRQQTQAFRDQAEELYNIGLLEAEEWVRAQDQVNEKLREASKLLSAEQNAAAYESLSEQTKNLLDAFEGLDATIEGQLGNTLKDFVETGSADMKKLGQTIINEVIQAMLKALVLKPLLTGIGNMFGGAGGGAVGGIFGGLGGAAIPARASGGPVKGRSPYLVGERGPELFVPPTRGTIIDANKTAAALTGDTATSGERGPQNIYQIDARGADAGAVQRLEAALLKLAGPGVVEKRARAAEGEYRRRG